VKLALQIAAGIVMAVLVIAFGERIYMEAELQAATEAMAKMNADAARANTQMQAQRDAQLMSQRAQADAMAQARLQENAASAQEQAHINLAAQRAAIRKKEAWSRFFTPAKDCERPKDWDAQVQCGNAYMRAMREFETHWTEESI
jgi:Flp pilus assembly protein TadG